MKELLQVFMRRLTNLSSHNRSLILLRLGSGKHIDLHAFDFLLNKPSFSIIEKLISGIDAELCSQVDPRDKSSNKVSEELRRLKRTDRFIFEERGARDLYVGWPFIKGKFNDGTAVRCPLLFFPIELLLNQNKWKASVREDPGISFNKSFFLAYWYFNGLKPDDDFLENNFEEFDRKSRPFRTQLYNLIKDSGVKINFNTELFEDSLVPFKEYRKPEYIEQEQSGMLKLFPEAVMGVFPQAGSFLIPDYREMLERNEYKVVDDFFEQRSAKNEELNPISAGYFLNRVREEQIFTPLEMDAWQENALKAVKQGHSVVIQGPPGTGKSQLLCNLIADFIARGKSVLAVSQKRAALDVVYGRLKETGIGEFCALVHDFRNDRKAVYERINDHIGKLDEYKSKNSTLDAIQLERNFLKTGRKIDGLCEELDELKNIIFDETECGISLKELYLTSDKGKPFIDLRQVYRHFKQRDWDEFTDTLNKYVALSERLKRTENYWRQRVSFADFGFSDEAAIIQTIEDVGNYTNRILEKSYHLLKTGLTPEDFGYLENKSVEIAEIMSLMDSEAVFELCKKMLNCTPAPDIDSAMAILDKLPDCYKADGAELSLSAGELGKFQDALQHLIDSRKNPFRWLGWKLFNREKFFVKRVLVANHLESVVHDLKILTSRLDNRLHLEHYLSALKEMPWITDFPDSLEYEVIREWSDNLRKAIRAYQLLGVIRNLEHFVSLKELTRIEFRNIFVALYEMFSEYRNEYQKWKKYLSPAQIKNIANKLVTPELLSASLRNDFDYLCEFDRLKASLEKYETEIIEKIMNKDPGINREQAGDLFQNSIRLAWIEHLELKYPVIRTISTGRFDENVLELQSAVKFKRKLCNDIILLRLRERTYEGIRYNRLNNRETYRDLEHQVNKKRNIWPIRKLLNNFHEEILKLQPCWLTSPESASAIFPLIPLFDLVIFDEASQCFSEKGLPSMYKGKQMVIAGDSKQLSPYDLYQSRWNQEEDNDENADLEVDSLLDFASRYLMQMPLHRHYRSQTPDLIEFSNHNFYKDKLKLLPDRHIVNRREPAIRFIKAEGVRENNCNLVEAEKVLEILAGLNKDLPGKSVGIITFNSPQQELIADKIETFYTNSNRPVPPDLFIKNIENVQGDERDIIIFSLVHAPDESGRVSRQFGSLNIIKGENRLNVAITRARERIFIVSSFWPEQLDTLEVKNEGPKLLKEYLVFALEVSKGNYKPFTVKENSSKPSWYLSNRLLEDLGSVKKNNISFSTDLPFGDIAILQEDLYNGLLITDDDHYFKSLSVKDIHVYTPFLLSSKNWKFRAVFSRDYWNHKDEVLEEIGRFIYQNQSAGY